jgi:hypothetical protein
MMEIAYENDLPLISIVQSVSSHSISLSGLLITDPKTV